MHNICKCKFICVCVCISSKLKRYFWPPVPNLDKVLQGYLVEMNGQRWVNDFNLIPLTFC